MAATCSPPHSLTLTFVGACLLWVGWFGFNAGSNLEATGGAARAHQHHPGPGRSRPRLDDREAMGKGKASLLGIASGAVAGLVAITPAAGLAGPMGSIVLGLVAGAVCYLAVTGVKNALGYDDALDVFGIHGVGGIIGAIGTGIVAAPSRRLRPRRVLHQRPAGRRSSPWWSPWSGPASARWCSTRSPT